MRRNRIVGRVALATSLAVILLTFGGQATAQVAVESAAAQGKTVEEMGTRTLDVTGTIEAAEKSFFGRVKTVQIVSSELGTFLVADDEIGRKLAEHVGRTVTVTARQELDDEGKRVLAISEYRVHEG
jgi:hypothetical protein